MPVEINAGVPRVLHCDDRADGPVPINELVSCRESPSATHPFKKRFSADRRTSLPVPPSECSALEDTNFFDRPLATATCRLTAYDETRGGCDVDEDYDNDDDSDNRDDEDDKEELRAIDERLRTEPLSKSELDGRRRRKKKRRRRRSTPFSSQPFSREFCGSEDDEDTRVQAYPGYFSAKWTNKLACGRSRSYIQLVVLLFCAVFGQHGLPKTSVCHFDATRSVGFNVLTIGMVVGAVRAAPVDPIGDAAIRAERSANLSHITGASRKIQMYIKNRHLQILPDGTVNGSNDDTSDYSE